MAARSPPRHAAQCIPPRLSRQGVGAAHPRAASRFLTSFLTFQISISASARLSASASAIATSTRGEGLQLLRVGRAQEQLHLVAAISFYLRPTSPLSSSPLVLRRVEDAHTEGHLKRRPGTAVGGPSGSHSTRAHITRRNASMPKAPSHCGGPRRKFDRFCRRSLMRALEEGKLASSAATSPRENWSAAVATRRTWGRRRRRDVRGTRGMGKERRWEQAHKRNARL